MTECHRRYSRHHCFARIPKSAAARLTTRLVNQRVLITATLVGISNSVESGSDSAVSLRKDCILDGASPFWMAIRERSWTDVCELSGWRRTSEARRNAVRTAEKRPAWGDVQHRSHIGTRNATYEYEESVDVVCEVGDHVFIVAQHGFLDELPSFKGGMSL